MRFRRFEASNIIGKEYPVILRIIIGFVAGAGAGFGISFLSRGAGGG